MIEMVRSQIEDTIKKEVDYPTFYKVEMEGSCIKSLIHDRVISQCMDNLEIDIDQDEWDYYELNDKINEILDDPKYKEDLDEIAFIVENYL